MIKKLLTAVVGAIIGLAILAWTVISPFWLVLVTAPLNSCYGKKGFYRAMYLYADKLWRSYIWYIEVWGQCKVHFSGEDVPMRESAICMTNHRFALDWLTAFSLAYRKGRINCCKILAKYWVKYVPGFGWGGTLMGFPWMKRDWTRDRATIDKTFNLIHTLDLPVWMIIHPEGTRLTPQKLAESQDFAKKNDLPQTEHVLVPRVKGTIAMIQSLRHRPVNAVYDLTFLYPQGNYSIWTLISRQAPPIHIHVRRYDIDSIPTEDDEIGEWVKKVWFEKEALIEFFNKNGHMPQPLDSPPVFAHSLI